MALVIRSAKRVDVTKSRYPKVICVGTVIRPNCAATSCAITAFDSWRKAVRGCAGRLRTKSAKDWMYSGLAAYNSGVKHHGKMLRITISGTLPNALAVTCHPSTTVLRNGSVFAHALCRDNDLTLLGYLAASHMPVAAPSDRPEMCAFVIPTACMNAATSSAKSSVE